MGRLSEWLRSWGREFDRRGIDTARRNQAAQQTGEVWRKYFVATVSFAPLALLLAVVGVWTGFGVTGIFTLLFAEETWRLRRRWNQRRDSTDA